MFTADLTVCLRHSKGKNGKPFATSNIIIVCDLKFAGPLTYTLPMDQLFNLEFQFNSVGLSVSEIRKFDDQIS